MPINWETADSEHGWGWQDYVICGFILAAAGWVIRAIIIAAAKGLLIR